MRKPVPQYQGFSLTFQVTEDCNLRCRYCYVQNKKPGTLPVEYARRFLDIILDDPDPIGVMGTENEWILKRGLILDFIGGDALMEPDLCHRILSYAQYALHQRGHRWRHRWRSSISTNGTLLGKKEVRRFLDRYRDNLSLGVSVDGCPEIQEINRPGSMKPILENWNWYLQYAGRGASTKSTLNRESIPYLSKSVRFLHEDLGLEQVYMNFIFEDMHLTEDDYSLLEEELEKVVEYVLKHRKDLYLSLLSREFGIGNPCRNETLSKGWCGSGSMPSLSVGGKIYPCFRFLPATLSPGVPDFSVGNVHEGLTSKERFGIVQQSTRESISPNECLSCAVESTCAWCIGGAYAERGEFYRMTYLCRVKKIIDRYSRLYWEKYDEVQKAFP